MPRIDIDVNYAAQKAEAGLKNFGKILAGVFAADKIKDFAQESINAASDLNETLSKSSVVFGSYSKEIEKIGDTSAESMGLSKQAAIEAMATYGNLFKSMGLNADITQEMSVKLVQLAADFASFNNIPVADALEKIRAGLVGESEPLKSLGININEAALKQEALNLGLANGKEPLDAAAKAQAAYSLILQQSSTAQGDFARTADGAANQARIFAAQQANLNAEIGKNFLPLWTEAIKKLNEGVEAIRLLVTMNDKFQAAIDLQETKIIQSTDSLEDYQKQMIDMRLSMLDAKAAMGDLGAGIEAQRIRYDLANGIIQTYIEKEDYATEAKYRAAKASIAAGEAIKTMAGDIDRGAERVKFAETDMAKVTEEALGEVKDQMGELTQMMSTQLEDETDKYGKSVKDLTTQIGDNFAAMQKISKKPVVFTPKDTRDLAAYNLQWSNLTNSIKALEKKDSLTKLEKLDLKHLKQQLEDVNTQIVNLVGKKEQSEAYDELLGKQSELKASYDEAAAEHEKATKRILYDMLLQQLAIDKIKDPATAQKAMDVAMGVAEQWGLISPAEKQAYEDMKPYTQQLYDGSVSAKDIANSIAGIPDNKNITVTLTQKFRAADEASMYTLPYTPPTPKGSTKRASGGDVEAGEPYIVGEHGPEPFVPKEDGHIYPTSDLGKIGGTTINVYGWQGDPRSLAAEIERQKKINELLR